ncbi:hypothetical protein K438DRAFT_2096189 [Mycena galopus ATCC 62051]|nr:hypothetical protein K438DRAFT_2096189 [Mycena galopus ATCC 62051]
MGTPPLDSYHDTKFSQPQNFDPVDLDAREGETLPSATSAITYPPARRLAQAKYRENHKEEERRKVEFGWHGMWQLTLLKISSWKLGRYRASIKADPECVQEQKDRQKCADKAYRENIQKREKRKEANAQKGTKQGYQTEEKRDYALEYALWTHRKQDELQKKVSDALWRDKDGPAALDNRSVYTFCPEGDTKKVQCPEYIPWGGATRYSSWEACLPAWHACYGAGEHTHPASPATSVCLQPPQMPMSPPHHTIATCTPPTPNAVTSVSPSTMSTRSATSATCSTLNLQAYSHTNPSQAPPCPCREGSPPMLGIDSADNPQVATYVAAGHTLEEEAKSDGICGTGSQIGWHPWHTLKQTLRHWCYLCHLCHWMFACIASTPGKMIDIVGVRNQGRGSYISIIVRVGLMMSTGSGSRQLRTSWALPSQGPFNLESGWLPPVPLVTDPEEQGPVPPMPLMPWVEEPETTEMNIDEPTGGSMIKDLRMNGFWVMDPVMRMRDQMMKERNCLQC